MSKVEPDNLFEWDQRKTLRPPPYTGALKKYLSGIEIGDPILDQVPAKDLYGHAAGLERYTATDQVLIDVPEPEWIDWDAVERGQILWQKHLGRTYQSLGIALLAGFNIARFAEVLYNTGYAQNGKTAFERYNATGIAICDWFIYSLRPDGKGRRSAYIVRKMHAFARRNTAHLFDKAKGEGVPLSQYDMAEVLLGFAVVTLHLIENSMKVNIDLKEKEDMTACWRLIGYLLGINDEYNPCRSFNELEGCFQDYMTMTALRFRTRRFSTKELQRTAIEGFGQGTSLGQEFYYGLIGMLSESDDLKNLPYYVSGISIAERTALPGMEKVSKFVVELYGSEFVNAFGSKVVQRNHAFNRSKNASKEVKNRIYRVTSLLSLFADYGVWRIVSFLYVIRKAAGILFILWLIRKRRLLGYLLK